MTPTNDIMNNYISTTGEKFHGRLCLHNCRYLLYCLWAARVREENETRGNKLRYILEVKSGIIIYTYEYYTHIIACMCKKYDFFDSTMSEALLSSFPFFTVLSEWYRFRAPSQTSYPRHSSHCVWKTFFVSCYNMYAYIMCNVCVCVYCEW